MTVEAQFWIGFIVALIVLGGIVYVLARTGKLPATRKDAAMTRVALEQKVADLEKRSSEFEATVRVLQGDHVRDVQRIGQLERELADAKERIRFLEGQQSQQAGPAAVRDPDFPLLVIFGQPENDPDQITQNDETALNQTGIPYRAIYSATKPLIAQELNRRRVNGDLYRWLHIASHGGNLNDGTANAGTLLADAIADREWWNKQLAGIVGVFLAGCTEIAVADWLVGVVNWVVSFSRDVGNDEVRQFGLVFWGAMAEGKSPRDSYRAACRAVPALAKSSDFRQKG